MRTTVTLDDDVAAELSQLMRERGLTFKAALARVLRRGLAAERQDEGTSYSLPTFRMGLRPGVDLDSALRLAAALEDEATIDKLELRK